MYEPLICWATVFFNTVIVEVVVTVVIEVVVVIIVVVLNSAEIEH